jgi:hypothetical protein
VILTVLIDMLGIMMVYSPAGQGYTFLLTVAIPGSKR